VLSAVLVGVLACLALSLITTYSRAGYIGFAIAFVGALYVAYRGGGHVPFLGPTLLVGGLAVVTVVVAPQLLDSITKRFEMGSYKHSKRRSQSDYAVLNQYAGDRLDLWAAAIEMTKEDPVFGVGFRVYNRLLPKMHRKGVSNSPHNQYLGALAETGIVGLVTLLGLYWYVLRQVFDAWRRTLARGDVPGQICTGAAFISFVIMLGLGMTSDFLHPSVKTFIFWLLIGAGVKYGLLLKEEEEARPTRAAA
jgi:O-antigen ligase